MTKILFCLLLVMINLIPGYSAQNKTAPMLVGVNLWQAIIWASKEGDEHLGRLRRELDHLKSINVDFVRIIASIQKHPSPYSIQSPCQHDQNDNGMECLKNLKIVLNELNLRQMKAIVVFNNFWHWSGGFNSLMNWTGEQKSYDFGPTSNFFSMTKFFFKASRFYHKPKANDLYDDFVKLFFTEFPQGHPSILSYQLANEPTPFFNHKTFKKWVNQKFSLFRSFDQNTPITLGGVGTGPNNSIGTKTRISDIYSSNQFGFLTVHLWPQNWKWYNPRKNSEKNFQKMLLKTKKYIIKHAKLAKKNQTPLLLEEFGLARDESNFNRDTPVSKRNRFYQYVIKLLYELKYQGYPIAGLAFWAWGGEGIPNQSLVGDPPHEHQGWYSIFNNDYSTLDIIKNI